MVEVRVLVPVERNSIRSKIRGRAPTADCSRRTAKGTLTKRFSSALGSTGRVSKRRHRKREPTLPTMGETVQGPLSTSGEKRPQGAIASRPQLPKRRRSTTSSRTSRLLTSQAGPVVEMEGRKSDHARLEQLPGLRPATSGSSRRPATHPRDLRHGGHRLAASRTARRRSHRAGERAGQMDEGPTTRSSTPPDTRRTWVASGRFSSPGDTVICDSGDHASSSTAAASPGALRPFRHAEPHGQVGEDAEPRGRGRRRRAGHRRRASDGGRRPRPAVASSSSARATARG